MKSATFTNYQNLSKKLTTEQIPDFDEICFLKTMATSLLLTLSFSKASTTSCTGDFFTKTPTILST